MQYDRRMSIDRDGFLSPDIAEIRDRCRSQHRDSFEMITEINRVAQAVLPGFSTLQSTDKNSIACHRHCHQRRRSLVRWISFNSRLSRVTKSSVTCSRACSSRRLA
jgi:hypothetical protein